MSSSSNQFFGPQYNNQVVCKCAICGCHRTAQSHMERHLRKQHGVRNHCRQFFSQVWKDEMSQCPYCHASMSPLGVANHIKHKHPERPHPGLRADMQVEDFLREHMLQHAPEPPRHTFDELECAETLAKALAEMPR